MAGDRLYVVYDSRAYTMDPSDCEMKCTALSLKEARHDRDSMFGGQGCAIYSYDASGEVLMDGRLEE